MKSKITSPAAEEKQDPIVSLQGLRREETAAAPLAKATAALEMDPSFGGLLGGWGNEGKLESKPKAAPLAAARGPSKFLKMVSYPLVWCQVAFHHWVSRINYIIFP